MTMGVMIWALERAGLLATLAILAAGPALGQKPVRTVAGCRQITLSGEVQAGGSWRGSIGQGWELRLVPVASLGQEYSGWDLVVAPVGDRTYPDALLLATPPYNSLNEKEIATTFGLRAQDAIAWMPRRFRFLTSRESLAEARRVFPALAGSGSKASGGAWEASARLLALMGGAAYGDFSITDAQIVGGIADPPAIAEQWATQLGRVPHTMLPAKGAGSARGELRWIRFKARLWLPASWKVPLGSNPVAANCLQ